ncbi:microtubule cross-linking factor 1-like [Dermochelys coriacea]|uniref:microtubule cross-linking factor 1-like n=1 Tax=Dermochelys coriacea TaxID=27794 RepID=UPI001CA988C3|nr:microtubule cross-linking factor 1-like [Dermochelys coriacea]
MSPRSLSLAGRARPSHRPSAWPGPLQPRSGTGSPPGAVTQPFTGPSMAKPTPRSSRRLARGARSLSSRLPGARSGAASERKGFNPRPVNFELNQLLNFPPVLRAPQESWEKLGECERLHLQRATCGS